jgi:hypothetical protein
MFTGIQILEPRIFDYIPRGVFSHSTVAVYPPAIARGERIAAHVATGHWYELSTIQRYLEVSLKLLSDSGQNVFQGHRSQVAREASVSHSILWDDVAVEPSGGRLAVRAHLRADEVGVDEREVRPHARRAVAGDPCRDRMVGPQRQWQPAPPWTGTSGIRLDTALSRLLFSIRFRDLNFAYRDSPALWSQDTDPHGFAWIDANDASNNYNSSYFYS